MNHTYSTTGEINAIAFEVMQAVNSGREDHSKTMQLLEDLQSAIQQSRLTKQAS